MHSYQKYLADNLYGTDRSLKRKAYELCRKNPMLFKRYCKLISWPIRKLNLLKSIYTAKRILDIGVGTGFILQYIRDYLNPSATFYGIDLDKNPAMPSYIIFKKVDLERQELPFPSNFFEIVISTFVIEHLHSPGRVFEETYRVLRSGGEFYLVTEYYTTLFLPDYWNFYQDPTHVRPYTKRSLNILAEMAGFRDIKTGIIRALEYLVLLPFVPILNLLSQSNFTFVPFEIIGRTVYLTARKA